MPRSVNKVILIGNLGRDAETKFTPSGAARTTFSIATSRRWKDQQTGEWKEETDWHNVVLWRQEGVSQYLTKGKQVYVEGRLQTRNYEDKDGKKVYATEVVAEEVMLLSSGSRGEGGGSTDESYSQQPASGPKSVPQRQQAASAAPREESFGGDITDDDVPF